MNPQDDRHILYYCKDISQRTKLLDHSSAPKMAFTPHSKPYFAQVGPGFFQTAVEDKIRCIMIPSVFQVFFENIDTLLKKIQNGGGEPGSQGKNISLAFTTDAPRGSMGSFTPGNLSFARGSYETRYGASLP
jgi:hypothetical protein